MKKPKVNLSGAAIKEFFINHGEKVGMGVAVLVMGGLIVMAIQQKVRPESDAPKTLERDATALNTIINEGGSKGPPPVPVAKTYEVAPILARIDTTKVKAAEIPTPPFFSPYYERKPLRDAPTLYPLQEPVAFADRAPFLFKGAAAPAAAPAAPAAPAGGAAGLLGGAAGGVPAAMAGGGPAVPSAVVQGRSFVMVTGLIPLLKQQNEYDAKFAEAEAPPEPPVAAGEKVNRPMRDVLYRGYVVERVEVVNGKQSAPVTLALGPMFSEQRSSWATATEEIVGSEYMLQTDKGLLLTFPLPPMAIRKWDERAAHPKIPLKSDKLKDPAKPAVAAEPTPMPKEGDPFNENAKPADPNAPVEPKKPEEIDVRLYRFWDWLVEPGKTYQYRVQLMIVNPNFKIPDRFLKSPSLAEKEVLPAGWSEWTPPVTIERDHQLYLSSVDYDKSLRDPIATVTCVTWDKQKGMEFIQDFRLQRGEYALFQAKVAAPNPAGGAALSVTDFRFDPKLMLVDFRGGHSSPDPRKHDDAAEAVFWDAESNQTVVRKQAVDYVTIDAARTRYQPKSATGEAGPLVAPPPPIDPGALLFGPPTGPTTPAIPKGPPKPPRN